MISGLLSILGGADASLNSHAEIRQEIAGGRRRIRSEGAERAEANKQARVVGFYILYLFAKRN